MRDSTYSVFQKKSNLSSLPSKNSSVFALKTVHYGALHALILRGSQNRLLLSKPESTASVL